ncbi:MAG: porin [Bacteroidota bacterium]
MYGGLLKTASAAAILAAAGWFGAGSAKAADLGGDCCADLEERVAELEATTVRKGNRKVSVTLSGFVGHNVMFWDDGTQNDVYIGDGGNYFSRFRFVGSAKISPTVTAGFLYEFGIDNNRIGNMNQGNGGDDLDGTTAAGTSGRTDVLRDSTVWLQHSQLGKIKVGHGSTATDNLVLIDLGGMAGAGTPDLGLYMGSFRFRNAAGVLGNSSQTWQKALAGHESFDTSRRNHVLYETPTIMGFNVQAAVAEDNYWDVALRYAGEFAGFRLAFGIGYQEDSEFNSPGQSGTPAGGLTAGLNSIICTDTCDAKTQELKGSASILHVASGLWLTGAGGQRQVDGAGSAGVPDLTFWYLAGGIRKNFFGFGDTVLFGEYYESKGGLANAAFLTNTASGLAGGDTSSKATEWGLGINQYIDAAAMEVFVTYKHFSLDANLDTLGSSEDFQAVIAGARVNF